MYPTRILVHIVVPSCLAILALLLPLVGLTFFRSFVPYLAVANLVILFSSSLLTAKTWCRTSAAAPVPFV